MSDTNQWEKLNLQYSALKPEPHIYEASCLAYRGLAIDRHNQSILVTGEPGIGKTETVKLVLSHLANMRSTNPLTDLCLDIGEAKIVEKVDMSNPIWEAFGNTKTLRNDNSSHFGRLIQLYFERQGSQNTAETGASAPICILKGSKCDTYFLEKSRVVSKGQNERNYQEISSFRYLMEQHSDLDLSSTKKEWEQTKHSLSLFGISNEKLHTLMQALLVTLLLGKLQFYNVNDNTIDLSQTQDLDGLLHVFQIDHLHLIKALTQRIHMVRGEEVVQVLPYHS